MVDVSVSVAHIALAERCRHRLYPRGQQNINVLQATCGGRHGGHNSHAMITLFLHEQPIFDTEGCRTAAFCEKHDQDGRVDVRHERCSHDSWTEKLSFNLEGSMTASFCKKYPEEGMVNLKIWPCPRDSSKRYPCLNVNGTRRRCTPSNSLRTEW